MFRLFFAINNFVKEFFSTGLTENFWQLKLNATEIFTHVLKKNRGI